MGLLLLSVLFFGLFSSMASAQFPQEPPQLENDLFNTTLDKLNESITKGLVPHPVNDTINTFSTPFTTEINCSTVDDKEVDKVLINVTTELVKWNATEAAKVGDRLAGVYLWNCDITIENNTKMVNCTNYLMLDPSYVSRNNKSDFGRIVNAKLLYHELLHGQLLIDEMKAGSDWKNETCKCNFSLDPVDSEHNVIPGLESKFLKNLSEDEGFGAIEKKESTLARENGEFEVEIVDISDLRGEIIAIESYVPPGGNAEDVTFEFPAGNTGSIILKGELIDKENEGKVEAYIESDGIAVFADISIEPPVVPVPSTNHLITMSVLGIALVFFLKREQK